MTAVFTEHAGFEQSTTTTEQEEISFYPLNLTITVYHSVVIISPSFSPRKSAMLLWLMWEMILIMILGSGVVSAFASHFLTTGAASKRFRREKLEELYVAARKYCENSVDDADLYRQTRRTIPPSELADFMGRRKEHDRLHDTSHMLTNLYFPELLSGLSTFEKNWESFIKGEGTSEQKVKESGATFVASIIIKAQRMNKPWYSKLKDQLSRSTPA
jgi:hypothetical protein